MEIKFKRTFTPAGGKRYVLGEIPLMLGYALEVADPRVKLQEGKLAPGEICMMIYGVTPEEYALKDSDPRALDQLAEQLRKNVPADRMIGWRIADLKGAPVQKLIKPQAGESIDGGEFARRVKEAAARRVPAGPLDAQLLEARRLQNLCVQKDAPEGLKQDWQAARKKLGEAICTLDKLWVAYDAPTGDRWPSVGFDGRVEIFTTAERAQRVHKQLQDAVGGVEIWKLREISGNEIGKLLKGCDAEGLAALRVDNSFAAAELSLRDFCEAPAEINAPLRSMMVREVQYGMRWNQLKAANAPEKNQQGALESMLTLRNFTWREIGNARLFALCAGGNKEHCVVLSGPDAREKLLAVFTSMERAKLFSAKVKGNPWVVEMKFDELVKRSILCSGLLVDAGFVGYRLLKTDFDKVRDLRGKPPVVVRVQKSQAEPAPEPVPIPRKAADEAGLPDPDQFDLPPKQPEPEAAPEAPAEDKKPDDDPPKKGFFRKIFGKG